MIRPWTQQKPLGTEIPQAPQLVQLLKTLLQAPPQQIWPAPQHVDPQPVLPPGQAQLADQLTVALAWAVLADVQRQSEMFSAGGQLPGHPGALKLRKSC